jgi:type IV pilus assembly protein PilA
MKSLQKGFTLIELMIVVAIIGILAAIAIPAYQDYTIRAQVTEGLSLASSIKAGVAETYQQTGVWPVDLTALGIAVNQAPRGKYVSQVLVTNGVINITYSSVGNFQANSNLNTKILSLQPGVVPPPGGNGDISWVCGRAVAPGGLTLAGANATSFQANEYKYLPKSCRP